MNFIKIPQLLIAILLVAFSLSNAFAAGEEEIIALISELPSDASTYTIKQQGEHWCSIHYLCVLDQTWFGECFLLLAHSPAFSATPAVEAAEL